MDKNNDIHVNKVNKWSYGIVDISLWHLKDEFDALVDKLNGVYGIDVFEIEELTRDTYSSMDKVLDRFNELEAWHQKDTGMISQYEEENRNLKSELDIKTDKCDALISRVFKQDDEYTKLEAEAKKLRENNELCMKAHLRLLDESTKQATENEELRSKCKSKKEIQMLEKKWKKAENVIKELIQFLNYEHIDVSRTENLTTGETTTWTIHNRALAEKTKHFDIQLNNLRAINRELKEAHDELTLENDRLTDRCDEFAYRSAKYAWAIKTILKKASYSPGHVAEELRFMARKSTTPKDVFERWEGIANELLGEHSKLVDKINRLEKKYEELSSQVSSLKENCGEIKWVLKEDDV